MLRTNIHLMDKGIGEAIDLDTELSRKSHIAPAFPRAALATPMDITRPNRNRVLAGVS